MCVSIFFFFFEFQKRGGGVNIGKELYGKSKSEKKKNFLMMSHWAGQYFFGREND